MRTLFGLVFTLSFILVTPGAMGQYEGNTWYFGYGAGIDFNSGSPVSREDGMLITEEGCATICNRHGGLLFYTDGIRVYNREHRLMPTGFDLMGHPSSTQSGIIVPWPDSPDIYFIFTVTEHGHADGLRYSVVDMRLDDGLGDIVSDKKNISVVTPTSERVAAVRHKDLTSYWVVTRGVHNSTFYAWHVTKQGLSNSPVISVIGSRHNGTEDATVGYLKFSQTGTKAAYANRDKEEGLVELFDFDTETGRFSNPITLPLIAAYGLEFAPNEQYLYATQLEMKSLVQYDISLKDEMLIRNSRKAVKTQNTKPAALQLGPDEKIYVVEPGRQYLHVINFPDNGAVTCDYKKEVVKLRKGYGYLGLPCLMSDIYSPPEMNARYTCSNDRTEIYLGLGYKARKVILDFGDRSDTVFEGFGGRMIYHRYKTPGTYTIQLIYTRANFTDTLSTQVIIHAIPEISLNKKEFICPGKILALRPSIKNADHWHWQNGETTLELPITNPGMYTFHAYNGICHTTSTVNVIYLPEVKLNLGPDTPICRSRPFELRAGEEHEANYYWSDGSRGNTLRVLDSGLYSVIKRNPCQTACDTIHISYKDCSCPVYIPDIFSPNKDMLNDGWKPMTLCALVKYNLVVYNRFGELIFQAHTQNDAWDGTFKEIPVQEGIYLYLLQAESEYGSGIFKNGSVTVVR